MEPTFEEFYNITSLFYRKIIRIHPKKLTFIDKYTKMLENFSKRKDHNSQTPSKLRKSRMENDDNKSVSNNSHRSFSKSYKSARNISLKSIETQYLFLSQKFEKTLAYACYYNMIERDQKLMDIVQTKTKFILESINKKQYPEINWDKANLEWKKIKQLLPNKDKVRWEKILGDSISALPEMFILIMLKGILNLSINIDLNIGVSDSSLSKLASQLKITITYFECQRGSIKKTKQYKGGKNEIKIGYLISDDKYGCFEKLPESRDQVEPKTLKIDKQDLPPLNTRSLKSMDSTKKSRQLSSRSKNSEKGSDNISESNRLGSSLTYAKRKAIRGLEAVLKESKGNTMKLLDLGCLRQDYEKDRKIKMRLGGK